MKSLQFSLFLVIYMTLLGVFLGEARVWMPPPPPGRNPFDMRPSPFNPSKG
uniref:Uncharacterized protein, isoform A n=2 Tax=Drosophila melanogaster TaxID=7227 RepID=A0A0B4LF43_DROME|nr:Mtk-like, isoform A [Drosophila melanogaster]NP_001286423.1 Mtk-like, isoform B [Drosophila melanogaster]AFH08076.1 Mtk-like, isoform A [Drosophila melanogaster]AHN56221.1 Mtk-like, isoform B [Drosophila melanogaster]|eukprot:NP_001246322.1 uncharacterized protein Dmel_CG43236, isoform A [Drosophila melanogaster]